MNRTARDAATVPKRSASCSFKCAWETIAVPAAQGRRVVEPRTRWLGPRETAGGEKVKPALPGPGVRFFAWGRLGKSLSTVGRAPPFHPGLEFAGARVTRHKHW